MAPQFQLIFVLVLVAACFGESPMASADTTTKIPGVTTTAQPGVTTTAQPGVTTTAQPGVTTTAQPGITTTAQPGITTTAQPGVTTTAQPGVTTTAQPGITTTAQPGVTTTAQPGVTTTAQPGITTTAQPEDTTTAQPGVTTTAQPGVTTTAQPGVTTTAQPGVTTTAQPGVTTTAQPGITTTAQPGVTTTAQPGVTTTAQPGVTTTAQPGVSTTAQPGVTTTAQPEDTTTTPTDPCLLFPCGPGSTCQPLANQGRVCLCPLGDFYNNSTNSCEKAKVFPGHLTLSTIKYTENLKNKKSEDFLKESEKVILALNAVFQNKSDGYSGSSVLEFNKIEDVQSRSEDGVVASVEIIFKTGSQIKSDEVEEEIKEYIKTDTGVLSGGFFGGQTLCMMGSCDKISTECSSSDGSFTCRCKNGYGEVNYSDRICKGCPSGQKLVDGRCINCDFGFSGFNCDEDWKLIVVILGTISGFLLIVSLTLLPMVILKSSKKSRKSKVEDKTSWHNKSQGTSADAFPLSGVPRIPRAMVNGNWDKKSNFEMNQSSSQQNLNSRLYEDSDDMAPYNGSKSSPYAQNRPQVNPYASGRGQNNPYYTHDNGHRYP